MLRFPPWTRTCRAKDGLITAPTWEQIQSFGYGAEDLPVLPVSQQAERLEEYKFLRTELEAIWTQTYATLNFVLAFLAIVIGAGLSKDLGDFRRCFVFAMASVVTLGAYYLILVHTIRVWRIAGYMRCELEPKLSAVRWETRLAARCEALAKAGVKDKDRMIFDGHMILLDCINIALLGGALFDVRVDYPFDTPFKIFPALTALIPLACIAYSMFVRRRLKRRGDLERDQLQSWQYPIGGKPAFMAEPGLSLLREDKNS